MSFISPFFRSPYTDLTACAINHQTYGRCAEFELKMVECMEAYGLNRAQTKCTDLIEDFRECASQRKQQLRVYAMSNERERQYKAGESKEHYAPPPRMDAY